MTAEVILTIIGLVLTYAAILVGAYNTIDRKVAIFAIKILQLEKEVEFLKNESNENKVAIQNALIEIQKSIHSIELKFEQIKVR